MYLYPMYVTDRLINYIAESEKILPYLDLPLQHINDTMLRRMARRRGFEVIGSYDPGRIGLDRTVFKDEHHLRPAAIDRLFAQTLGRGPRGPLAGRATDRRR